MTCRAQDKVVFAVVFGVISSSLQLTSVAARDTTPENKMNVWTKCKGDNLELEERSSGLTALHVYVFRNGESVASTTVPAAGHLKGRLIVKTDSSVVLSNLSSGDLGVYRVEVKMSEEKSTERSVRLVVGEPPETVDGKLMAMLDTSNDTVIGLKCGLFTSLGYPPVSALWKDPSGQLLASTGFTGGYFTLDLPADIARSGRYCCHLDCGDPNLCCLDDRSPLRQCAPIDVQTDRKTQNAKCVAEETELVKNFDRLERRVSAMDTILQELEKSERQQQSQMCVAAMFYQIQREAKCEQLDSSVDKLLELQGELWDELNATKSNLSRALQQSASVESTLTEAFTGQQHKTDLLTSKMSDGLSGVKKRLSVNGQVLAGLQTTVNEDVVNYLSNISQTTGNLHSRIQNEVASVHDTLNDTLNKNLAKLQDNIKGWTSKIEEVYQTKSNLSDICQQSFKEELIKHHTLMEVWMSKMSLEINETTDELSSTRGLCASVEDGVKEGLKGHKQETEAWMLKMSEELSQIKNTVTTLGQLIAQLEKKIENRVSEVSTKVTALGSSLQTHVGEATEFFTKSERLLPGGCSWEKGYRLHGKRCLKFNATRVDFESAKRSCLADGGHMVHVKSREDDVSPLLELLAQNVKELNTMLENNVWVGLDDILTEGTFVWSDGSNLPTDSDLWDEGQPDDYQNNEDCVHTRYSGKLLLNDIVCNNSLQFVCQIDLSTS